MAAAKRKYNRLNEAQWAEAIGLFEAGAASANRLAEMFNVSRHTMSAGLKKRGAEKGKTAPSFAAEVAKDISHEVHGSAQEHAQKVRAVQEQHFETASEVHQKAAQALDFDPNDAGSSMRAKSTLIALEAGMKTLERAYAAQARVLGIRDNDTAMSELPDLVFRIVSDEEIRTMTEKNIAELGSAEIDHKDDAVVEFE